MANERLRQAIKYAGLEPDGLADLIEVDIKTVQRWLSGRTPYTRHRAQVAKALGVEESELWPELATAAPEDCNGRGEIQGAWAHADDDGVPDWRELLVDAVDRVELLDYSLLDVVSTDGVIEILRARADAGVKVRILISAPDSVWVTARSRQLGQQEDYVGRPRLQLEIESARAYLEPLTTHPDVELGQFYADPGCMLLRFDNQMLVVPHLYGIPPTAAPLLQLRRMGEGGPFDQWATHLRAISERASEPIQAAPELYPNPTAHPERYRPLTKAAYERDLEAGRQRSRERSGAPARPIEEVRAEIRRIGDPADATPTD